MGAVQLSPGWVSLRQLSLENGFSHGWCHEMHRRGMFTGCEVERAGPRGWWRVRRGPALDLAMSAVHAAGDGRRGYSREHDSRRERRRFLEDVATGRRKTSPEDVRAARAVLMVGLGLVANRKPGQRFRATIAACEVVMSALSLKRSGDARVADGLAAVLVAFDGNGSTAL